MLLTISHKKLDSVAELGGAIYLQLRSEVTITNSTFAQNKATSIGGVLFVNDQSSAIIYGSYFKRNYAMK